jgi:hypothetical protein
MKKFAIKKPSSSNPDIWEWKTHRPVENSTFVAITKYDTREAAEAELASFGPDAQVVEVNVPD